MQNPATERLHQPCFLGNPDEVVRIQQSIFGMAPAHQRLHSAQPKRLCIEHWLIVQLELVARQRRTQFIHELIARQRASPHLLFEELEAVSALGLDAVERKVRLVQQPGRRYAIDGRQ